jgi:hypothetical protein
MTANFADLQQSKRSNFGADMGSYETIAVEIN